MTRREWFIVFLMALITYAAVCSGVYRFQHPELTDTQLLLDMPKALMWWRQ